MSTANCPIKRNIIRRLRAVAVLVNDASGVTRFDGDPGQIEASAQAYGVKGEPMWTYETRGGTQVAWPRMAEAARDPQDAMADRALYLAERFAEMNARAWREAYATVGALMATTIEAQAAALAALGNRTVNQEELLDRQNAQLAEAHKAVQQGELDQTLGKVLDLALASKAAEAARAAKPAKPATPPNGAQG